MSCDGENTCKYTIHIFQRVVLSMPLELILYLKSIKKKKNAWVKISVVLLLFIYPFFCPFSLILICKRRTISSGVFMQNTMPCFPNQKKNNILKQWYAQLLCMHTDIYWYIWKWQDYQLAANREKDTCVVFMNYIHKLDFLFNSKIFKKNNNKLLLMLQLR